MTSSYIAQWEKNPLISQFVQLGYIDYAIFDIETDHSINLIRSGKSISPLSLKTPPFIICSNVLSYLPQDILMVEDHHIKQSYLTLLQYTNQSYQYPFQSYEYLLFHILFISLVLHGPMKRLLNLSLRIILPSFHSFFNMMVNTLYLLQPLL